MLNENRCLEPRRNFKTHMWRNHHKTITNLPDLNIIQLLTRLKKNHIP